MKIRGEITLFKKRKEVTSESMQFEKMLNLNPQKMKKIICSIIALGTIVFGLSSFTKKDSGTDGSTSKKPIISICCDIVKPSTDCKSGGGLCNCRIVLGRCNDAARTRNLEAKVSGNNFFFTGLTAFPLDANEFVFDVATPLPADIAKELGYASVTIQPGTYQVHNEDNKPKVKLDVVTTPL